MPAPFLGLSAVDGVVEGVLVVVGAAVVVAAAFVDVTAALVVDGGSAVVLGGAVLVAAGALEVLGGALDVACMLAAPTQRSAKRHSGTTEHVALHGSPRAGRSHLSSQPDRCQ